MPIHPFEAENVQAIRDYVIDAGDKQYKIFRGDMHRHTDVSQDFKYDGSLIEVYRYAMDVTAFDYMVPTDHQLGYDQEFTWWQDEKLTDLFNVPGVFMPLFGYERSVTFPNGHRNVIFPERGTRPLPIPQDEARGQARTGANLFPYLKQNNGISMPHSSGTAQGTDFADNDPDVEPLIEIFQGYRASYEYMGAPLAASPQKLREQRSGFNPLGYYWDALAKGYKIGVQASSDHWSTHISYAMIVSDDFSREGLFNAMKQRHAYGATDNIILDFRAESGGKTYIMGDIIDADEAPRLTIKAVGTDRIKTARDRQEPADHLRAPSQRRLDRAALHRQRVRAGRQLLLRPRRPEQQPGSLELAHLGRIKRKRLPELPPATSGAGLLGLASSSSNPRAHAWGWEPVEPRASPRGSSLTCDSSCLSSKPFARRKPSSPAGLSARPRTASRVRLSASTA